MGGKRADTRRTEGLEVHGGVKDSCEKKLMRNRLKWADHMASTGDEKVAKRSDAQKVEGTRPCGNPRLRWEV